MPYDYFDGVPIAGQTKQFMVTFASEADLDALARAQAILLTCERDLDQLQAWFKTDLRAGADYGVWVHVNSTGGGGLNYGYESDESSRIIVSGTFAPTPPVPNQAVIRDEYARLIFVAELAEILMDFTGYGWNRGASAGEALSIVLATELHPAGYYGAGSGPRVNTWLNSNPRPDWVSATEGTDKNKVSYGCGVLFLYYLRYDNGIDYTTIVTAGGSTLAETYVKIFGGDPSSAFGGFAATLQAHVPVGTSITVPRDNIFPLKDPGNRVVTLFEKGPTATDVGLAFGTRTTTRKAGPDCPARDYPYQTELSRVTDAFQADARGFLQARFSWRIGDTTLDVRGKQTTTTVPVTITDTALDDPVSVPGSLTIDYIIGDSLNQSLLQIKNDNFPGNLQLGVAVDVVENLVPGDTPTTREIGVALALLQYRLGFEWGADVFSCNPQPIFEIDQSMVEIANWVLLLLNTPDPAPMQIFQFAAVLQGYQQSLAAATGGNLALAGSLSGVIASVRAARLAANPAPLQQRVRTDGPPFLFRGGATARRRRRHCDGDGDDDDATHADASDQSLMQR